MPRNVLDESQIHPAVRERVASHHAAWCRKCRPRRGSIRWWWSAWPRTPYPRKARKALDAAGVPYHYLSYGNYFGDGGAAMR
jgi:monothiol glutaredoxin